MTSTDRDNRTMKSKTKTEAHHPTIDTEEYFRALVASALDVKPPIVHLGWSAGPTLTEVALWPSAGDALPIPLTDEQVVKLAKRGIHRGMNGWFYA